MTALTHRIATEADIPALVALMAAPSPGRWPPS